MFGVLVGHDYPLPSAASDCGIAQIYHFGNAVSSLAECRMTNVDGRFAPVGTGLEGASHTDARLRLTSGRAARCAGSGFRSDTCSQG